MKIQNIVNNITLKDSIYFSDAKKGVSYPQQANSIFSDIENDSFWYLHRNNCILHVANKNLRAKQCVDIGGGNGYVSKFLKANDYEVALIEADLMGCIKAIDRGIGSVICSRYQDLDIVDNSIQVIGLFDVLEHIEDDEDFLLHIRKNLLDNGQLIMTVPAYNMLWSSEDEHDGHYRRYTRKTLVKKLKKAGFEIDSFTYIFMFLPIPIFFARTIPAFFRKILHIKSREKEFSAESYKKTHIRKNKSTNYLLNIILKIESYFVKRGVRICFGGSILLVAKKSK